MKNKNQGSMGVREGGRRIHDIGMIFKAVLESFVDMTILVPKVCCLEVICVKNQVLVGGDSLYVSLLI